MAEDKLYRVVEFPELPKEDGLYYVTLLHKNDRPDDENKIMGTAYFKNGKFDQQNYNWFKVINWLSPYTPPPPESLEKLEQEAQAFINEYTKDEGARGFWFQRGFHIVFDVIKPKIASMMQEKDEKIELEKLGKSEYFKLFNNGCERIQELTAENIRVKEVYRLETACHEQQIKELQSQLENVSKELVWTKNAAHIHLKNEVMFQEEFEKAKLRIKELEGMTAKQTIIITRKSPKGG